jgi:hypothetical protein
MMFSTLPILATPCLALTSSTSKFVASARFLRLASQPLFGRQAHESPSHAVTLLPGALRAGKSKPGPGVPAGFAIRSPPPRRPSTGGGSSRPKRTHARSAVQLALSDPRRTGRSYDGRARSTSRALPSTVAGRQAKGHRSANRFGPSKTRGQVSNACLPVRQPPHHATSRARCGTTTYPLLATVPTASVAFSFRGDPSSASAGFRYRGTSTRPGRGGRGVSPDIRGHHQGHERHPRGCLGSDRTYDSIARFVCHSAGFKQLKP